MHYISKNYHFNPSIKTLQLYSSVRKLMIHQPAVVALKANAIMEYDWGSSNKQCLIYQLTHKQRKKYAELWMGTHPNGPSMIDNHIPLTKYLQELGVNQLPFLYKVLCIEKALSIQLHPNKAQAQKLHLQKPLVYDNNEKPQMFYTLTEFQCFFGIVHQQDINRLFAFSPFSKLHSKAQSNVKQIIRQLIAIKQQDRVAFIEDIMANVGKLFPERQTVLGKLQQQFPNDIGIAVSCLLNYRILGGGECYAIGAGVPHAYISGTCLQVMANSDNVVRLGLTPKPKDVQTMLQIINDKVGLGALKVQPNAEGEYTWNHLMILQVICEGQKRVSVKHMAIGVVLQGKCVIAELNHACGKGDVLLVHPGDYTFKGKCSMYFGSYKGDEL